VYRAEWDFSTRVTVRDMVSPSAAPPYSMFCTNSILESITTSQGIITGIIDLISYFGT